MNTSKLSAHLAVALDIVEPNEPLPLIVCFRAHPDNLKAATADLPCQHHFRLTPLATITANRESIRRLSYDPRVVMLWRDLPAHACLDRSVPLIGAPGVWTQGYQGRGIRIAVVDSGVDPDHPALKGRVTAIHDVTQEGLADRNGHGTHVAGIAAGDGNKYRGVAPEAEIMAVKVLRADGSGSMSEVMEGIEWALENGARVINLSLGIGGATDGSDPLSLTCDAAVARGAVVCAAAGNEGPRGGSIGSPGAARNVITVGASTDSDQLADFSSRGPTADGRTKPDILMPGYGIVSCRARGTNMGHIIDEFYTEASGTSMATPHVAGTVALLLEAKPDLNPGQVKNVLMRSCASLGLPPNSQGAGRVDAYRALTLAPLPTPLPNQPEMPETPLNPGCFPLPLRWPLRQTA